MVLWFQFHSSFIQSLALNATGKILEHFEWHLNKLKSKLSALLACFFPGKSSQRVKVSASENQPFPVSPVSNSPSHFALKQSGDKELKSSLNEFMVATSQRFGKRMRFDVQPADESAVSNKLQMVNSWTNWRFSRLKNEAVNQQ